MSKSGNLAALAAILNTADTPIVYYAEDSPYLPRILVFYWPVQAIGSLSSTSRIRTTILSAAGFKSYGAFQVSPSSAYYTAVHKLPSEKQRDDVARGIAFALCRYFSEVPAEVKAAIVDDSAHNGGALKWGQAHAAQVTCRLNRVINVDEVVASLRPFSKERPSSPTTPARPITSIRKTRPSYLPQDISNNNSHGRFAPFTPSRRIPSGQRTPSYSTPGTKKNLQATKHSFEQMETLRFKMCEFVDTEDNYIAKLQSLIELVATQSRNPKSLSSRFGNSQGQKTVNAMLQFPSLLDQMKDLNIAFLDDIETALQNSEESAMIHLERGQNQPDVAQGTLKDSLGALAFARVLLNHFPKLTVPYREYLDVHSQISSNLDQFLKEGTTSIQQVPSLLMEPAQRISRYGLYIDSMIPQLPPNATIAARTFEKARKIIAEICEMEPAASAILDGLHIEHEGRKRALSPTKIFSSLTRSSGNLREVQSLSLASTPRLLPALSRSFSRKSRPKPLREQNIEQAINRQENTRPSSSSSSLFKRPPTSGSMGASSTDCGGQSAEKYKILLDKAEAENYRLLQENAELKRQLRTCTCKR